MKPAGDGSFSTHNTSVHGDKDFNEILMQVSRRNLEKNSF